jgi:hypothetical protein
MSSVGRLSRRTPIAWEADEGATNSAPPASTRRAVATVFGWDDNDHFLAPGGLRGWMDSPRASISTYSASLRSRVSERLTALSR